MNDRNDIMIAVICTVALLFAMLIGAGPIRFILAAPLILFIPGYLALRAVDIRMAPVEQAVAASGISIAICLGGGIILNFLDILTVTGWCLWTLLLVIVLSTTIIVRDRPGQLELRWPEFYRGHIAMIVAALLITGGAYSIAVQGATNHEFKYTEFWALPISPGKFVVGIKNSEDKPATYDIVVSDQKSVIGKLSRIRLEPDQNWTHQFDSTGKISAVLYRNHSVYRRVTALPYKNRDTE